MTFQLRSMQRAMCAVDSASFSDGAAPSLLPAPTASPRVDARKTEWEELTGAAKLRRTRLLQALGVATSSWYRQLIAFEQRRRPGPAPQPIAEAVRHAVITMAVGNPW